MNNVIHGVGLHIFSLVCVRSIVNVRFESTDLLLDFALDKQLLGYHENIMLEAKGCLD